MAHILGAIVINMAVSNNRGGPPKWMVKIMENPINPRMTLGGENPHYFRFNIHMDQPKNCLRRLSWEEEELDIELLNDAGIQAAKARPGWCWRELQNVVFFFGSGYIHTTLSFWDVVRDCCCYKKKKPLGNFL